MELGFLCGGGLRVVGDGGYMGEGIHLCRDTVDLVKLPFARRPN